MDIDIKKLSESLNSHSPRVFINIEEATYLYGAKLFSKTQKEFVSGILYVGYASMFPQITLEHSAINFLCIEDVQLPQDRVPDTINVLLIENTELSEIFNFIQDIFIAAQGVRNNADRFLDSLVHGRGLQYILDIGCELLRNPIVVIDRKGNLMARSSNILTDDPLNFELINNGFLSKKTIDFIQEMDKKYNRDTGAYPYIVSHNKLKYDRIVGTIFLWKKPIATLIVWNNNNPFKNGDIESVSQLCGIISSEMQRSDFYNSMKGIPYETFMSDILDGIITEQNIILNRTRNLGWNLNPNLFLLVIDINAVRSNDLAIAYVRDVIEVFLNDSKTFIYQDNILVLIDRYEESFQPDDEILQLYDFFRKNQIHAGMSNSFQNLADIPRYYRQSLKALEVGLKLHDENPLYFYEDCKLFHMLSFCNPKEELIYFCHPVIFKILAHDKANNTEYGETLDCYLSKGKDYVKAANTLHIHQNTILYRIRRIRELFDIDFSDGRLLFSIYLSFRIIDFDKCLNEKPDTLKTGYNSR